MEWDKFWSQNAKMMDKTASRYMALGAETAVPLTLANFPSEEEGAALRVQLHPKDASLGYKAMTTGSELLVEREDAAQFVVGTEVTLMRWGNAVITAVAKDASGAVTGATGEFRPKGDPRKTKHKLTWLNKQDDGVHLVACTMVEFDHVIDKVRSSFLLFALSSFICSSILLFTLHDHVIDRPASPRAKTLSTSSRPTSTRRAWTAPRGRSPRRASCRRTPSCKSSAAATSASTPRTSPPPPPWCSL